MLTLDLFKIRNFGIGNLATFTVYAGLSLVTFLLVIFLQQTVGYTALNSGLSLLPVTILLFIISPIARKLSSKYGPRWFMALGPIIAALGVYMIGKAATPHIEYWKQLFPAIMIFGVGLGSTVAPLTAAILGAVEKSHSGIASAINNAVSRIAGLLAVAIIGVVSTFNLSMYITAALLLLGGIISAIGITNNK